MTRRPRSHQLEDESEIAFRRAIPSTWVYRRQPSDYGIDGIVEIFANERTTGLLFHVQLKATDSSKAAFTFPLHADKAAYYSSLESPVLLVRYFAPTDLLLAKWWHACENDDRRPSRQQLLIRLSEQDIWTPATPDRLHNALRDRIAIKKRSNSPTGFPTVFTVSIVAPYVGRRDLGLVAEARSAANSHYDLIDFRTAEAGVARDVIGTSGRIQVDADQVTVEVAGVIERLSVDQPTGHDIAALAALSLSRISGSVRIGSLLRQTLPRSSLLANRYAVASLAYNLLDNERAADAVELMIELRSRSDNSASESLDELRMLLTPRRDIRALSRYGDYLRQEVDAAEQFGTPVSQARAHYNLGSWLADRDAAEALHEYEVAVGRDPDYGRRWYYNRDVGDVLLTLERYQEASTYYDQAYAAAGIPELLGLAAESRLLEGRYSDASALFGRYVELEEDPDPRWTVIGFSLEMVLEWSPQSQTRRSAEARAACLPSDGPYTVSRVLETTSRALAIDSICGSAWFNRGIAMSYCGDWIGAAKAFAAASIELTSDREIWINLLWSCHRAGVWAWIKPALRAGYYECGQDLIDALYQSGSSGQLGLEPELQALIDEVVHEGRRSVTFEVRMFVDDDSG